MEPEPIRVFDVSYLGTLDMNTEAGIDCPYERPHRNANLEEPWEISNTGMGSKAVLVTELPLFY